MDFNNDGILDLVLGERDGYYSFYTGNGDGTLHFIGFPLDDLGDPIERVYNTAGYLDDWNEDGYIDFIAGGYDAVAVNSGRLEVHLNTSGDITSPAWSATVIDLTPLCNKWRVTHQTYDLDMDGDKDLIFGYEMGNVWFAENIGTNSDPVFNGYVQLTCDGGNIDVYNNFSGGGRARENVVDFNSDGIPDILVGCNSGWIYYFEGYGTGISEGSTTPSAGFDMTLSESPTTGLFSVSISLPSAAPLELTVFDSSGRIVTSVVTYCGSGSETVRLDISDAASGMYIVTGSVNGITETAKLIKLD